MARPFRFLLPTLALAAAAASAPAQTVLPPDAAAQATSVPEPAVQRQVSEDDHVRIEEVKVRGQTQSIVVHGKAPGSKPYEIVPSSGSRDPSQPGDPAGRRVWRMLSF
ncbi:MULTISPECIES: hypothetical protein [Rubrivivax]|uniref:DUF2782 domain-containing protein n=1 Tax=Rubrivivax benzoatilyticus TaxID=316997 RepID=A0ABX0I0G7_9BURK|nr:MULTISPECIES: hypothetical protein [Rubrivivax]MCD0417740.1 hypothetical protein [Rubrivivax sp. JA1024]EGJ10519.1 hypothetical protein RBXJA2T_09342 [Rubrivivax benzoatilyticus JA2 = ATCC BAA-35]MCC9598152.1 hypothetical protein [Rubrivivax sp. JA1055]MCC9645591.1 hypothetical protein [Rubrivivax sp. JA1029]NHK99114.1 hypothetical protein [Rubrivivax benzoatilyticus]